MPNELFNLFNDDKENDSQQQNIPIQEVQNQPSQPRVNMRNPLEMLRRFGRFKRSMAGKNPKQIVQGLLDSGQMTQEQFQEIRKMADGLQGFLR